MPGCGWGVGGWGLGVGGWGLGVRSGGRGAARSGRGGGGSAGGEDSAARGAAGAARSGRGGAARRAGRTRRRGGGALNRDCQASCAAAVAIASARRTKSRRQGGAQRPQSRMNAPGATKRDGAPPSHVAVAIRCAARSAGGHGTARRRGGFGGAAGRTKPRLPGKLRRRGCDSVCQAHQIATAGRGATVAVANECARRNEARRRAAQPRRGRDSVRGTQRRSRPQGTRPCRGRGSTAPGHRRRCATRALARLRRATPRRCPAPAGRRARRRTCSR
jgi:hypothetical protein